jgi:hypothetical protein
MASRRRRNNSKRIEAVLLLESPLTQRHLGLASSRRQTPVLEPLLRSLGFRVYGTSFLRDADFAVLMAQAANRKLGVDIVHVSAHGEKDALVPAGMKWFPLSEEALIKEGYTVTPLRGGSVLINSGKYQQVVTPFYNIVAPKKGKRPLEGKVLVISACDFINSKTGPEIRKKSGARAVIGYSKTARDNYCNIMEPLLYFFLFGYERVDIGSIVKKVNNAMKNLGLGPEANFEVY